MKRLMLLVGAALVVPLAGCSSPQCCTNCGWGLWFSKPPSMEVKTPILLTPQLQSAGAYPMGSAAGPVPAGQYEHAPVMPMGAPAPSTKPGGKVQLAPISVPCVSSRLSCDEWLKMYQECKNSQPKLP